MLYDRFLYTLHYQVSTKFLSTKYYNCYQNTVKPQSHRIVRFVDHTIGCDLASYDRSAMFAAYRLASIKGGGGGVLWGGPQIPNPELFYPSNPKSQKNLPLKSQIPKNLPLKSQIPNYFTPQIPNPKFFIQYY